MKSGVLFDRTWNSDSYKNDQLCETQLLKTLTKIKLSLLKAYLQIYFSRLLGGLYIQAIANVTESTILEWSYYMSKICRNGPKSSPAIALIQLIYVSPSDFHYWLNPVDGRYISTQHYFLHIPWNKPLMYKSDIQYNNDCCFSHYTGLHRICSYLLKPCTACGSYSLGSKKKRQVRP